MKSEKTRMLNGELYNASDQELSDERVKAHTFMRAYNNSITAEERNELIKNRFKKTGKRFTITPPIYVDYGSNITIGENFYANFDTIFLDVNEVIIGDNVMFGPRVSVYTASHPFDATIRTNGLEYGLKIMIGNNVWIGGNTVINPGVKIGDNAIIGSGSVVTKDIPSDVIAVGNPCKVLKKLTAEDYNKWKKLEDEYYLSKK